MSNLQNQFYFSSACIILEASNGINVFMFAQINAYLNTC